MNKKTIKNFNNQQPFGMHFQQPNFHQAQEGIGNLNAFYNNEQLFGLSPVQQQNIPQKAQNPQKQSSNKIKSQAQKPLIVKNQQTTQQIKQPVIQAQQQTYNIIQNQPINNQKFVKNPIQNNNLFTFKVFENENQKLLDQNKLLYQKQPKEFQSKYPFNSQENQQFWSIILNSIQCPINVFFNFTKQKLNEYENTFNQIPENQKFTDPQFKPSIEVLNNKPGQFQFKRASEIYEQFDIFDLSIEPNQIQQGILGDCYLISSIISLSEKPEMCIKLFINKNKNNKAIYGLWICESGEWTQIIIDDFLVCQNNSPCFAKSIRNGIWVQLLEKAYAKCYGGYQKIEVGYSCDSLKDLTGCPTEYIDIKNQKFENAFIQMKNVLKKGFILTVSSKIEAQDLISKHSYTIFDLKEVLNKQGKMVKMLKIKNPLGFGFQQNNTQQNDEILEQNLGEPTNQKNGIWWMSEKDFLGNFEVVTSCKIHEGYCYSSFKVQNKSFEFIRIINIKEGNHCYFSIHQKHEKYFKQDLKDNNYYYKTAKIIVCEISNGKIIDVKGGSFSNKQSTFFEFENMKKGDFLVFVEVDKIQGDFVFSQYCQFPVSVQNDFQLNVSAGNLIQIIFQEYISKINSSQEWNSVIYDEKNGNGKVIRDFGSLFGFSFISYRNQSSQIFNEDINIISNENIDLYDFDKKNQQNKKLVKLNPNEQQVVLFRILEKNNCSHALKFKGTYWFGNSNNVIKPVIKGQSNVKQISQQKR
ncbi:hypothetical protein IMG5_202770 [Ichthyophthirius multifiliis]|uniref:Calpain catalytic domain-containing protein n=1 Tax=Ichthyophthirius multifiliis TaxID=5932 RepID=G0R675_ICHMU|nr:hypothetical protein IMG5_202770 [Ichthyophthirius multifiliis]EGR27039.1 hypothetical protein IMG5_202770 [Ichthyophthirius multifiliis]|eukprot:XP_004023923.1 hypothetical protein IMG5_202770 [Ichthyophthirius multifiliis]